MPSAKISLALIRPLGGKRETDRKGRQEQNREAGGANPETPVASPAGINEDGYGHR